MDDLLFRGLYPTLHNSSANPVDWYENYLQTYLERDVREIQTIRENLVFQKFMRLCAGRTGQLLNYASLADDCGIGATTARVWLSILEAGFIVFRLQPHHRNFGKRMVRRPKIYFLDPGLAAHLMGIENSGQIATHPLRGALFETWVFAELLKSRLNCGLSPNLYFWRDNHGHEVDFIQDDESKIIAIDVKSGASIALSALSGLKYWRDLAGGEGRDCRFIHGGSETGRRRDIKLAPWNLLK